MRSVVCVADSGRVADWRRVTKKTTMEEANNNDCTMPGTCHWGAGKVALVTGAARQMGRKVAAALHRHGYNILIHCHTSLTQAQDFALQLNTTRKDSAHVVQANLSTEVAETAGRLVTETVERWGRLDLLVNNAGCYFPTPVGDATSSQWDQMMDTNAKAPYFLTQAAAPHLRERGGSVVNVTDILGDRPVLSWSFYSISKAALIMATKCLAVELGPKVRVNYVNPGAVMWPEDTSEEQKKEWLSRTALGRVGTGEEVANAVVFLASPSSAYMTGNGISMCGGRNLQL